MPIWTWFGLKTGRASTSWPEGPGPDGQDGVLGMPRLTPDRCRDGCRECLSVCPTRALSHTDRGIGIDYGRCVVCQLCVETCPTQALAASHDWAFGVRAREDLRSPDIDAEPARGPLAYFGKSLHIRHVDAGSCNGCESDIEALANPFYNLHRLGIFFTPSPRFADLLLVTGPVTYAMREPLLQTYEAMPKPAFVLASGTCAVSGGTQGGGYACGHGLEGLLPVDLWLPGCPPNPAALIEALLVLLDRRPQRLRRRARD